MSRYIYRVRRHEPKKPSPAPAPEPESVAEVPYRDLQAQAKAGDIPANQSREALESALGEAEQ